MSDMTATHVATRITEKMASATSITMQSASLTISFAYTVHRASEGGPRPVGCGSEPSSSELSARHCSSMIRPGPADNGTNHSERRSRPHPETQPDQQRRWQRLIDKLSGRSTRLPGCGMGGVLFI